MSDVDELTKLFTSVGFEEPKVKEIVRNKKLSESLYDLIKEAPADTQWEKTTRGQVQNLSLIHI